MFSNPLQPLAKLCSIVGGLLMIALMLMTCYSLISRNVFDAAIVGDFELTGIASGIAIAFFMPLCQLHRENIIVDFFTANRSAAFNHRLDRFADLLMTLVFGLLAWRCALGALNARETLGASMLLGFPDWIVFTGMSIPFGLTALIALNQTFSRFQPEAKDAS